MLLLIGISKIVGEINGENRDISGSREGPILVE